MKQAINDKTFSIEEYIEFERGSSSKHEFINGQLFEMPGEKDINNEMAGAVYIILVQLLKSLGYQIFNHDIKVGLPERSKYYYPDVFATKEEKTDSNKYIKYQPELIVEVVSESTQINDYVDKYIDYTTIPSLKYYIIIEPETVLIIVYSKDISGQWSANKFTDKKDIVHLSALNISFSLQEIYS